MKKIFLLVFYIALIQIGFAQNSEIPIIDSTSKPTKSDSSKPLKIKVTGIFISAGINSTQYNSDAFINYWYNKAGFGTPLYNYHPPESNGSGGGVSGKFSYGTPSLGPYFSVGLELNANEHIKLHHVLELSYMQFSTNYSGTTYYTESYSYNEEREDHAVWDTVQGRYTQTVLSIGYRFQPTFKFIFLSVGINCSVNLIKAEQHKYEQATGGWSNEFGYGSYPQTDTSGSVSGSSMFINFPLQVGAGGVIHKNSIILEPAFYFTYCFMKGYNLYNLSLKIIYNPKRNNPLTTDQP